MVLSASRGGIRAALLLGLLGAGQQARAESFSLSHVLRIDAIEVLQPPQIAVYLTHLDRNGGVVPFDKQKPHLLFVNSEHRYEPISAQRFDQSDKSLEVLLVIQASSAMEPFMGPLRDSTRDFVDLLPKRSQIGVLTYAKTVLTTQAAAPPDQIKDTLKMLAATDSAEPNLPDALQAGLDRLAKSQAFRRVLVVVSDGLTASGSDATFLEIGDRAFEGGVELNTIGVALPGLTAGFKNLKKLHVQGRGSYRPTEGPSNIAPAFKALANEISGQHVLRYAVPKHFNGKVGVFQIDGGGIKRSSPKRFELPVHNPTNYALYIGLGVGVLVLLIVIGVVIKLKGGKKEPKPAAKPDLFNKPGVVIKPENTTAGMVVKPEDEKPQPKVETVPQATKPTPPQPATPQPAPQPGATWNTRPKAPEPPSEPKPAPAKPEPTKPQPANPILPSPTAFFDQGKKAEVQSGIANAPPERPQPEKPAGGRWNAKPREEPPKPAKPAPVQAQRVAEGGLGLPSPTAFFDAQSTKDKEPEPPRRPPQAAQPTAEMPRHRPQSSDDVELPSPTGFFDAAMLRGEPKADEDDDDEMIQTMIGAGSPAIPPASTDATLLPTAGMPAMSAQMVAAAKAAPPPAHESPKAPLANFVVASTQILEINELTQSQGLGWIVPLSSGSYDTVPLKDAMTIGPSASADVVVKGLGDQGRVKRSGNRWFLEHDQRTVGLHDGERFWLGGKEFLFKSAERLTVEEMQASPFLHVMGGPDNGRRISLREGERAVVGSHGSCDGLLRGAGVGARHMIALVEGEACRLIDLGAEYGLVHEGRRVFQVKLKPGERVKVGGIELEFRVPQAA